MSSTPDTFETAFDTYARDERLGEGGTGCVYRVIDSSGKCWALKLLNADRVTTERRKRFQNEIHFGMNCRHRNIVPILDCGIVYVNGKVAPFYVMPFYSGTLRDLMRAGISSEKILPYFIQILDGVEAAHLMGIVHRDIKPENVLYDQANDRLLIADFGIAHFAVDQLATLVETSPNMRTGSFLYSAPEQRVRGADIGWFADIYALGLILNEMFTGQVLQGTSYRTILTVTSEYPYLDDLVSVMTRQSPNERPASINAIKLDLKARGDAYVTQQQLSRERARVIQATEMDDPLVLEPPKVISFDWSPGTLELILSCPVNQDWVHVLQGGGIARYHQSGYGPDRFAFRDNIASVQIGSEMTTQSVQRVIDDFKEWITATNREYAVQVRRRMDKEQSRRVAEKAREIASLERKQKMLRELKV